MGEDTQDKRKLAIAMLSALRRNVPEVSGNPAERFVSEYHAALDILEGIGLDTSPFRIPGSEVWPRRTSTNHVAGRSSYSDEKYVDKEFLLTRLDTVLDYLTQPVAAKEADAPSLLEGLFSRFHQVARQLRERHDSRETLHVKDEYDVQDLLHALLKLYFDDVRPEEWTPSYAGSSSRMDFLLKNEGVVVEVKKTRENLGAKEIGKQLIDDIAHYKEHSDCRVLASFIYDPEGLIGNPTGLRKDLESTTDLEVRVFVYP